MSVWSVLDGKLLIMSEMWSQNKWFFKLTHYLEYKV